MSRKNKIDPTEIVKIVERLLAHEISISGAAQLTGVDQASIRRWRDLFLADGPTALMAQRNNKVYSRELKLQAVHEYLDGKSNQADIVKKYHLRSSRQLFHSDRGFQYTSKQFTVRLKKHHMKQSMSRVAHCIDNGPMEGFWGILKRETYYGKRFTSKSDLINAIESYVHYYNTERIQRKLHLVTPVEYHENYNAAA